MANKSEKIGKLITAVNKVMLAVNSIEKNSTVGKGDHAYKGTKDMDVKLAFKNEMANNGLAIFQVDVDEETTVSRWEEEKIWNNQSQGIKQKQSVFTKAKVTYLLCHTSEEWIEIVGFGHGVDAQDKGAGKVTTYSLKNLLMYTFLTPSGDIDDTDSTHSDDHKQQTQGLADMTEKEYKALVNGKNKSHIESYLKGRNVKDEWKKSLEEILNSKTESVGDNKKETPKPTKLVKDSDDWKGIVKYIKDGKLKDLKTITKFTVTVALKKELQAMIVEKNPELAEKPRPKALTVANFNSAKKGTKVQIQNTLDSFRMSDPQRKELEELISKMK